MAGVQIDPETGLPVFDPSTDPATMGTTLTANPFRGFGATGATAMRGPQSTRFPQGFGAQPATPMRGPKPTFPYPDPNSFNPIQPAGGPDAPTNSWFQRPSGKADNGAPALGDVDSPGGSYGGGAQPGGPWQTGPGRSPSGWSGPDSGGIGSDARFPTADYGPPHVGGSPTNPIAPADQSGGSVWGNLTGIGQRIKNMMGQPDVSTWGQQAADAGAIEGGNPAVAQPVGSGNNPAPTLPQPGPFGAPSGQGGIGSDANFPLTGGGAAPQRGMPWAGNNGGRPYGQGAPPGRAPPLVNLGRGAPGVAAPHPAVAAAAAHAAAMAGQQPDSPFTMVLRPNASANSGGRGSGGSPLSTALDLSGYRPQAAPAPAPQAAPRPRVQGPLAKSALPRRTAAPAPYPVTESGSPTPMSVQGGRPGPADYGDMTWLHGTQPPW